jgi:hypothetical protein
MRYLCKTMGAWASAACAAVLSASCSDGSERFFVVQNQVPEAGCVIPGARGTLYRGSGTLDVGLVSANALVGYRLYPLLQSDLPALGESGGTEPNRIALRELRVRLEPGPGAPQELLDLFAAPELQPYLSYGEPWSGTLEPGGGTLSASVTVVTGEVARAIRASGMLDTLSHVPLTARVRAVGDTLSDAIESREFVYPIKACQYCLVSNLGACPVAPVNTGNACNIAQDNRVDCCSNGQAFICPSVAPATATN